MINRVFIRCSHQSRLSEQKPRSCETSLLFIVSHVSQLFIADSSNKHVGISNDKKRLKSRHTGSLV